MGFVFPESNAARAVGQGGVSMLLTLMCDWHRNDVRNRHVRIRKAILNTIKNVTALSKYNSTVTVCSDLKI